MTFNLVFPWKLENHLAWKGRHCTNIEKDWVHFDHFSIAFFFTAVKQLENFMCDCISVRSEKIGCLGNGFGDPLGTAQLNFDHMAPSDVLYDCHLFDCLLCILNKVMTYQITSVGFTLWIRFLTMVRLNQIEQNKKTHQFCWWWGDR